MKRNRECLGQSEEKVMSSWHERGRAVANAYRGRVFVPVTVPMMLTIMTLFCVSRADASGSYAAVSRTNAIERCGRVRT